MAATSAARGAFPAIRPRRRRQTAALRALVREHHLHASQLIHPIFVTHGRDVHREISSMPGVHQLSVDERLDAELAEIRKLGLGSVLLFGLPAAKDPVGEENFSD